MHTFGWVQLSYCNWTVTAVPEVAGVSQVRALISGADIKYSILQIWWSWCFFIFLYILCPASRWPWTSSLWTSASLSTRLSLSWSNQTWWSSRHKSLLQTLRESSSPHSQVGVIKYHWTGPVWRQSHHMISYSASRLLKTAFLVSNLDGAFLLKQSPLETTTCCKTQLTKFWLK